MGLVIPDTGLLFWMIISFSITFWLLAKYAWKPIMKSLRKREDTIDNSLKAAKQAKIEMEQLREDNKKIIIEARSERDGLLQEAKEIKDKMIRKAEQEAKERADKIIEEARVQIQSEKQNALNDIKSKVAELSIDISEKILRKELDNKDSQQDYIDSLVKEAKLN
ncbi:MAG: F0F1 ATP synthase subunit B [Bacteroidales bacterium]|nr:F0F1 ATP synthase subunit B [Bacteroidales bacterium]